MAACVDELYTSTTAVQGGADDDDGGLRFEKATYHVTLSESTAVGTTVLRVRAVASRRRHLDDVITYGLSKDDERSSTAAAMFAIDRRTGELSLRGHLVRRRVAAAVARLTVTARSARSLPVYADVVVRVVGATSTTTATVMCDGCRKVAAVGEDAPPGTQVLVVLVDSSSRRHGPCSLVGPSSTSSLFELRRTTHDDDDDDAAAAYQLVTTSALDREVQSVHRLDVECRRSTAETIISRSVIDVNVLDVNDNRPRVVSDAPAEVTDVLSQYTRCSGKKTTVYTLILKPIWHCAVEVTVSNDDDVGAVLATVTALDRDAGENATLTFTITRCTTAANVTSSVNSFIRFTI